ncbi:hypothetical protein D3C80_1863100 [compost metagenome]
MKRKLGRFGEGTQQNQQHGRNKQRLAADRFGLAPDFTDTERAGHDIQHQEAGKHCQTAKYRNQH